MKANSEKTKQSKKATRRVLAGVLCGASVLSLVLSLVMPPISQAIANDAQTVPTEETVMGGGSSSESADVDNTNNGDTENQNSDDAGKGKVSCDVDAASQSSDDAGAKSAEQPADDGTNGEGAIALAAENEPTIKISSGTELSSKLVDKSLRTNGAATFELTTDIECDDEIKLEGADTNITLNLNGFKIKHTSSNQPLFSITGGAKLTVRDGRQTNPTEISVNQEKMNGNLASMECDNSYIPKKLTYYVTESVANGTGTTETLKEYKVDIKGAIVACGGSDDLKLVNLYKAGTFNLESGAITQQQNSIDQNNSVNSLVYAEEGSIVNMSGGYVCGATSMNHGAGIELGTNHNSGATLNLTGGVIAGNYAPIGGGVNAYGSKINMTRGTDGTTGTISGNGTFENLPGYGAGICAQNSDVTVSDGYVTNNNCQFDYIKQRNENVHKGNGCHGGGGIAAFNGGSLTINGGYITGNYSAEAGGGIYAGAWGQALSSFKFSGGTIASNVAQNSEGGGIRISAPTVGDFNVSSKKAYITNNTTNTTNDWGGGGVFVQGSSDQGVKSASLNIYNALITNNHANGFGGGFAACPTGKTAITDTNGIAVFGNSDGNPGGGYNRSGGTHEKTDDKDEINGGEITGDFITAGHQDLFLIRDSANAESLPYIAAVTGQMLGGGAANWSGTIDKTPTSIGKYEGAQAKYMIGLKANPFPDDQGLAVSKATLFITHNSSNVHGGGIMTNGDVVAGSTAQVSVYPKMKLNGIKKLTGRALEKDEFEFELLKQNPIVDENGKPIVDENGKPLYTVPSFDSKDKLQLNGCSVVGTVRNDIDGNFTFDLGEVYADDALVYYLVEVPDAKKGVTCDEKIYKIDPKVVPDEGNSHWVLDIKYTYYKVESVSVTVINEDSDANPPEPAAIAATEGENAVIVKLTSGATFTNKYDSKGSWTPAATKVVEGGEMKEFTLQLAKDSEFKNIIGTAVTSGKDKTQTLSFKGTTNKTVELEYSLSDIKDNPDDSGDSTGGPSKTFTYYVREMDESTTYPHYKFDQSVYRFDVTMKDNGEGKIEPEIVTFTKIKDARGDSIDDQKPIGFDSTKPESTPTFTNTYSTTLPLSGMSGVTLTYLAGAAVLCAAAAWMHIRRKANAKGGERRE